MTKTKTTREKQEREIMRMIDRLVETERGRLFKPTDDKALTSTRIQREQIKKAIHSL